MRKSLILLIMMLFCILSFAQSKGESMFLKAEHDIREMYLDYRTHSLQKMILDYSDIVLQLDKEYLEQFSDEQMRKNYSILMSKCLCRLGELKMYNNIESSMKYYSLAADMAKRVDAGVELESGLFKLMFDVYMGAQINELDSILESYSLRINSFDTEKAIFLNNTLAIIEKMAGNLSESLRLFRLIREIDCGQNDMALIYQIRSLTDYSDCLLSVGLLEQSIDVMADALTKLNILLDKGFLPQNIGFVFYSWGMVASSIKDEDEAIDKFRRAIDFMIKIYGEDCIELVRAQNQLANSFIYVNKFDEAFSLLDATIKQSKKEHGDYHTSLVQSYSVYSLGCLLNNQYEEAREKALESVRIAQAIHYIHNNPYLMLNLSDWFLGDYSASLRSAHLLLDVSKEKIHSDIISLPENNWESYWINNGAQILSVIANSSMKVDEDNGLLYDASLFCKGVLLNTYHQLKKTIASDKTGSLKKLQDRYRTLYAQADYLSQGDVFSQKQAERSRREAQQIENEMMTICFDINDYMKESECSWKDVESYLGDGEVAIEFIRYPCNLTRNYKYVASLIKKGGHPINIALPLLNDEYLIKQAKGKAYKSTELYLKGLAPLLPYLEGCKKIWFSPTGVLASIAIENIKVSRSLCFSDLFDVRRLSSTRKIVYGLNEKRWETASLYGGLNYDLNEEEIEYYKETVKSRGTDSLHEWNYLRGSLEEVQSICDILGEITTEVVTAGDGVKERFMSLSGKEISLIHLATHSFYQPDIIEQVYNKDWTIEETMHACGLVFAGANNRKGDGNGLLTAAEISEMDLVGCDLAVLSACSTGLNVTNYDESYGLMRAFKKAGCGSLLLTLWDIDDAITRLFMEVFYSARMSGANNTSSLNIAKKAVRNKYHSPKYWAGFILID